MKRLYTVQELADAIRLRPGTIRNRLSRGEDLPRSILVGRRRLFPQDGVESWLQAHDPQSALGLTGEQRGTSAPKQIGRPRGRSNAPAPLAPEDQQQKRPDRERCRKPTPTQMALFEEELI